MKSRNIALITGVTGQDGSYMADLLLSKGYEVHGLIRRNSNLDTKRIDYLYKKFGSNKSKTFFTHYADMSDGVNISRIVSEVKPTEVYNFAAQSHVKISFEIPEYTSNISGTSVIRLLEIIRQFNPEIKFYQASTSEMFGNSLPPQNSKTPLLPSSPYAAAKCYAYWICENYRQAYNLRIVNGILFNHESPRRGKNFVTKKIVDFVLSNPLKSRDFLELGNINSKRDWGYAPEYMYLVWKLMLSDFEGVVSIGTGESISVEDFAKNAFSQKEMNYLDYLVSNNENYLRPIDVLDLCADPNEIFNILGQKPSINWKSLINIMLNSDEGIDEVNWEIFD